MYVLSDTDLPLRVMCAFVRPRAMPWTISALYSNIISNVIRMSDLESLYSQTGYSGLKVTIEEQEAKILLLLQPT